MIYLIITLNYIILYQYNLHHNKQSEPPVKRVVCSRAISP